MRPSKMNEYLHWYHLLLKIYLKFLLKSTYADITDCIIIYILLINVL